MVQPRYRLFKMKKYFVAEPGKSPHGPYAEAMVKSAYEQGMYPPGTKVWWEGATQWEQIELVFGKGMPDAVPPPLPPPPPVPVMPPVPVAVPEKEEGGPSPDSAQESAGQWGCGGIWGTLFGLGIVVRWILRYYKKNDFGDSIGWDILFILLIVGAVVGVVGAICDHCGKK